MNLLLLAVTFLPVLEISLCGPFLAINAYPNKTIAAVSFDSSGALTYLSGADNQLLQTGVFSAFPSAAASGKGGLFYAAAMINGGGLDSAGTIFVFAKGGSQLIATTFSPYPPITLAEDTSLGKVFGVVFNLVNDTLLMASWDLPLTTNSLPSLVGTFPKGWLGTSSGGCYDPNLKVFYTYAISLSATQGNIFGMRVTDGTIVSTTPNLDNTSLVSSISCDKNSRAVSVAQDPNDPNGKFYLATIDVTTGDTTPIGSATFLAQDWAIMSVSINSSSRKWIGTFQNGKAELALVVADLDSGKVVQTINPWPQGSGITDVLLM